MGRFKTIAGVLLATVAATGCSSTSTGIALGTGSSSSSGGGASSGGTSYGLSGGPACAYQQRSVSSCSGDVTSGDWQWTCNDLACSQESWDPHTISAGDCWGHDEYQGSYDFGGSCADWQQCVDFVRGQTASCQSCVTQSCCSEALPCATPGTQCSAWSQCSDACGNPSDSGFRACADACAQQYPSGIKDYGAWLRCQYTNCGAPCGWPNSGDAG